MAHPQVIFSAVERFPNIYIHTYTYNVNLPYHVQPHLCHNSLIREIYGIPIAELIRFSLEINHFMTTQRTSGGVQLVEVTKSG